MVTEVWVKTRPRSQTSSLNSGIFIPADTVEVVKCSTFVNYKGELCTYNPWTNTPWATCGRAAASILLIFFEEHRAFHPSGQTHRGRVRGVGSLCTM